VLPPYNFSISLSFDSGARSIIWERDPKSIFWFFFLWETYKAFCKSDTIDSPCLLACSLEISLYWCHSGVILMPDFKKKWLSGRLPTEKSWSTFIWYIIILALNINHIQNTYWYLVTNHFYLLCSFLIFTNSRVLSVFFLCPFLWKSHHDRKSNNPYDCLQCPQSQYVW
jgi:hypothetical protein